MRPLLLSVLLIAGSPLAMVAEDTGNAPGFNDLSHRTPTAINSVCPLDGKPIDATLAPIPLTDQNGLQVYIGADSAACLAAMRAKFGPDAYEVIAAARANTTIKAQKSATAAAGSTALASTPQASTPSTEAPATLSSPGFVPTSGETMGTTAPTTAAPAHPAHPAHHHTTHHETASSGHYQEDSDERQRQKKAAQRRDGDAWEGGETGAESEHHHASTHHATTHRHSTSHSTTAPSTTEGLSTPSSSGTSSNSPFGSTANVGPSGAGSSYAPTPSAAGGASPTTPGFTPPPDNFTPTAPANTTFSNSAGGAPSAGGSSPAH